MLLQNNIFELKSKNCKLKIKDKTDIDIYEKFKENFYFEENNVFFNGLNANINLAKKLSKALDYFHEDREYSIESEEMKKHYTTISNFFNKNIYTNMVGIIENSVICESLDIMFIKLKHISVPIGYFKESRGVEAAYMLEEKINEDASENRIDMIVKKFKRKNDNDFNGLFNSLYYKGILKYDYIKESKHNVLSKHYVNIGGLNVYIGLIRMLLGILIVFYFGYYFYTTPKGFIKESALYIFVFLMDIFYIYKGFNIFRYGHFQYNMRIKLNKGLKFFDICKRLDYDNLKKKINNLIDKNKKEYISQARRGEIPEMTIDKEFYNFYRIELSKNALCKWMNSLSITIETISKYKKKGKIKKILFILIMIMFAMPFAQDTSQGKEAFMETPRVKDFIYTYYNDFQIVNKKVYFAGNVNLYKKRNAQSEVLLTIPANTIVSLVNEKNDNGINWKKIRYYKDNILCQGWVDDSQRLLYYHYLPPMTSYYKHLPVTSVETESYYDEFYSEKYSPENLIDSSTNTCWRSKNYSNGEGEKLSFKFSSEQRAVAVKIFPGASTVLGKNAFRDYSRLAEVEIKLSGDTNKKFSYTFDDREAYQVIWFDNPVDINDVEINVKSVYSGDVFDELVVAEVIFYGRE